MTSASKHAEANSVAHVLPLLIQNHILDMENDTREDSLPVAQTQRLNLPSDPATPNLTPSLLFPAHELNTNPVLVTALARLGNAAFSRSKAGNPQTWNPDDIRFPTSQHVLDMAGPSGIVAIILDSSRSSDADAVSVQVLEAGNEKGKKEFKGKLVACTTAVPWAGGWDKEGASTERGWEMKAVCVNGSPAYLRRGLAIQVMQALEDHLVQKRKEELREMEVRRDTVAFWILAAEDLNGVYWRKRGYAEVRRGWYEGIWGCRTRFEMVVLRKEVEVL
jgi:hypothetical protein